MKKTLHRQKKFSLAIMAVNAVNATIFIHLYVQAKCLFNCFVNSFKRNLHLSSLTYSLYLPEQIKISSIWARHHTFVICYKPKAMMSDTKCLIVVTFYDLFLQARVMYTLGHFLRFIDSSSQSWNCYSTIVQTNKCVTLTILTWNI